MLSKQRAVAGCHSVPAVIVLTLLGIAISSAVAGPFPIRPTATNAEAIIRSGIVNSMLIIADRILEGHDILNSQTSSDAEVLRVFKAPPGFQSKKILIGYQIGKYDPESAFFKEKPRTNTFLLFRKPGTPWKGWEDATGPNDPFVEATEANIRLLPAELRAREPMPRRNVLIAVAGFTIAGLVVAGVLWLNRHRNAK